MAFRNHRIFPVFAHKMDYTCMMCGDYLTTAVACPGNDLFCLDCIGPYLDIAQTVPDNVEADRPGLLGNTLPVFSATRSRNRYCQEANWLTNVEVTVRNGRDFVGAGTYTCDKDDRHPMLLAAIRNENNVCPICSTTGQFQLSHATDRELANHPVDCPFHSDLGERCLWSGRFAQFKRHTHVLEDDDDGNVPQEDLLQPPNQAASSANIAGPASATQFVDSVASHSGQILDAANDGGSESMQVDDKEDEEDERESEDARQEDTDAGGISSAASLHRSAGSASRRASQAASVTGSLGSVAAGGSSRGRGRDDEDSDDDLVFDYRAIVSGRDVDYMRTTDRGKKTLTMTVKYKL